MHLLSHSVHHSDSFSQNDNFLEQKEKVKRITNEIGKCQMIDHRNRFSSDQEQEKGKAPPSDALRVHHHHLCPHALC